MIGAVASVLRGEGFASAARRARERVEEAVAQVAMRARGWRVRRGEAPILNVAATSVAARTGGVAVQLAARLREERALREVALLHPAGLELAGRALHRIRARDFAARIREALAFTGATAVHFDGMSGVPFDAALQLIDSGVKVVLGIHDFSLFCARPHLLEQPADRFCDYSRDLERCARCLDHGAFRRAEARRSTTQGEHRARARLLLESAQGVIFPSRFLLERHRALFDVPQLAGDVIEPGVPIVRVPSGRVPSGRPRDGIAVAGSVKRHKGGLLLPALARGLAARGRDLHVFGGGDADLLQALRAEPNAVIHGYYRFGGLPALLARSGIGLVLLPSIVPEAHGLTLTETWLAGATAAAFDLGAIADRIREAGGGFLAPLESGVDGLLAIVDRWRAGDRGFAIPRELPTPRHAARAHVEVYRRIGVLPAS